MADIASIRLPSDLSGGGISSAEAKKLKNYLYQLTEQLRYVLTNLDDENMSAAYSAGLAGQSVQLTALTEAQKTDMEALQARLVSTANGIAHDYQTAIAAESAALHALVRQEDAAANESVRAGLESRLQAQAGQAGRALGKAAAGQQQGLARLAEAVDGLCACQAAWARPAGDALELGAAGGPYRLRIAGDRLSVEAWGVPVACVRDGRLYAAAAETAGRIALGGADAGGYYDLVPTAAGLGIQWRADA